MGADAAAVEFLFAVFGLLTHQLNVRLVGVIVHVREILPVGCASVEPSKASLEVCVTAELVGLRQTDVTNAGNSVVSHCRELHRDLSVSLNLTDRPCPTRLGTEAFESQRTYLLRTFFVNELFIVGCA